MKVVETGQFRKKLQHKFGLIPWMLYKSGFNKINGSNVLQRSNTNVMALNKFAIDFHSVIQFIAELKFQLLCYCFTKDKREVFLGSMTSFSRTNSLIQL